MSRFAALVGLLLAMSGGPAAAQGPAPTGAFEAPGRPVWAGEVFDLTLAWRVDWATFQNLDGELSWTPGPLVAEPWGPPALRGPPTDGWATIALRTRAVALQPGRIDLRPAQQRMIVQTGMVDMEEYRRAVTGPVSVRSAPGRLEVRPLPPAPPGFTGAVGRFVATSAVDKAEVRVGDPVTWTVTLTGVGNWPAITGLAPRQVSRDFEVLGAPKLAEDKSATLFERSVRESVTLVPQRAGTYVLGAFEMVTFDPQPGRYVTVRAPPVTLTIRPGPNGDLAPPPGPPARADADILPPMLHGRGAALAPPSDVAFAAGLALAPLALAGLWLSLALRRAWCLDPERPARGAHARLARTLARLAQDPAPAERRRLVRAWQADAGARWKLGRAAPTPNSFGSQHAWRQLWAEADLFLYGPAGRLPDDWAARASQALAELGAPPAFSPATTFRPANLLPAACAVLAVAVLGAAGAGGAAPALTEPALTEPALRKALADQPADWRTRHNLAVTLAARGRWDEAAGQAAVAWLQQPGAPETRVLWLRAAGKAGYSLDRRASVPRPRAGLARAAAVASPAAWRWLALGFAWAFAGGLALVLAARFGQGLLRLRAAGFALAAFSALGGGTAASALMFYGVLASPEAVLVWKAGPLRPLPVDTPAETAPVQLAAGAAGRVDREFLGWRRLRLGDGRAGWTRRENLVWVWTADQ
ncbi:BatD family protein [Phenylobacterium sp.]|uniref:BatD family protein n=1 Tax=Phenylobacterium sp. TaxID=1871053 RepID=UPI002C2D102C|nr:BatD family protein [Phenylobacterium sp.]HVI33712.1 BatD family protein [Phenylobacterium sp.]